MAELLASLVCGLVFGIGLLVAGMANPAKVMGFLDIAGDWDPSLALVMGGAVAVGLGAFAAARRRSRSVLGLPMHLPAAGHPDRRLIVGSAVFGIGWGLAGICPGPALVLIGAGAAKGWVFVATMLAGMALSELLPPDARSPSGVRLPSTPATAPPSQAALSPPASFPQPQAHPR